MKKKRKMIKRVRVLISGKVQGVGFRYFTKLEAKLLGLNGWVKNLDSGKVEAVFEGDKKKVEKMLEWCEKGPPVSMVKEIKEVEDKVEGLVGFAILK